MPIDDILLECEEKMEKAVEFFGDELRVIRTGRASAGLVEHIKVDYYGSPTDLRQLASISVPEPDMIVIKPFDPASKKEIEKAIQSSELGITPATAGKVIRLPIPALSGERRQHMVAQLKKMAEQARVTVRNVRREANKTADKEENENLLTEDDVIQCKEEVQRLTDQYVKEIDKILDEKNHEVMES
ncbi:MAG: ribosome recycling factor [Planctomycetota bacterium]|nr:ribosome recycling factor [Planctomycetota bacterium]